MSVQEKQLGFWEFPNEPSEDGKKKAKSRPSARRETSADMTLQATQLALVGIGLPSSMPVSLPQSKKKTSIVSVNILKVDILQQSLSMKLEADSTTKDKNFYPYWNGSCQDLSNVLWSLIKTGSQDLALSYSLGSAPKTLANSWFSTKLSYLQNANWLTTSLQSSTVSQPGSTDLENTSLKSLKIRVYPSRSLHPIWKKWLAASRYCFNQGIAYQRKHSHISRIDLRNLILNNVPDWVRETPYSFRVQAVYDAHEAMTSSRKSGTKQSEAGRFRSVRDRVQAIKFRPEDYKNGTWFPDETTRMSFQSAEVLPNKDVEYQQKQKNGSYKTRVRKQTWSASTQLVYDKKRWFAVFPVEFQPEQSTRQSMIALDPGVRNFLTGFDGKRFVEVGGKDISRVYRLCKHIDNLISDKSKLSGRKNKRQRQRCQTRIDRMLTRVRNLVDEVHKKAAKWLTSEYRLIFLPTFESSQMVAKSGKKSRRINSKTVRQLLCWSHYRFKQTLKFHALKRGATVIDVTEEFTSKTCTRCGQVHAKLGSSKQFKCPHCGHSLPRDWNGALGIFLKALRDIASVDSESVTVLCPTSSGNVRA